VGCCLTYVFIRIDMHSEPTFMEVMCQVRKLVLDVLDHEVPFPQLISELGPHRDPRAHPIFQTMEVLQPAGAVVDPAWRLHRAEAEGGYMIGNSKVDLHIELHRRPQGDVPVRVEYNGDIFEGDTPRRMVGHWSTRLPGIAEEERRPISDNGLANWGRTSPTAFTVVCAQADFVAGPCIHAPVTAQARLSPFSAAAAFANDDLTYGELERNAHPVASGC